MIRHLYSGLYRLALAAILPFEFLKRPSGQRGLWFKEKLGMPETEPTHEGTSVLWLHAVSVGEVIAAVPLVKEFKQAHPGFRVIVSTITDTGRAVAKERLEGIAEVVYLPFDLRSPLKRAIRHIRPSLFVVMETELWPNLFHAMHKAHAPVVLLNGRISDKSFGRYMKIRFMLQGMLRRIDAFCMQDQRYAERIIAMGARPERVHTVGNLKFDLTLVQKPLPWAAGLRKPIIVAGSTHKGEEPIIARAYKKVRERIPDASLILVPRHPNRAQEAAAALDAEGIEYAMRSALSDDAGASVIVLDTIGELSSVYAISDVAIMGGSFIPHGGQNPLEPASCGKPVLCGPHMHNFPFVRELYERGACLEVTEGSLPDDLVRILMDAELGLRMGRAGASFIEENRGAVKRAVAVMEGYIR